MNLKQLKISKIQNSCDDVAALLNALSHPGRILILSHLIQSSKTVSELQKLSGLSQSQLSQFLGRMRLEGLVVSQREGRWVFYKIADDRIAKLILFLQKYYCS